MTGAAKRLVYFDQWMDAAGPEWIAKYPHIDLIRMDQAASEGEIWPILAAAHAYQCRPTTETQAKYFPSAEFLDRCPNLLAVASAGAGYDIIDVAACTERGILVCNQSGANAESVAQHVLAMMLTLSKQLIQSDRAIRRPERNWTRWDYCGRELTEKTIGIVGLGNIGRRVSEICRMLFNMRVLAYDPYITDADFTERGAERMTDLTAMFAEADFISINCPLTDETRGMIGAEQYGALRPTAYFISTARGGIHDEVALEAVIKSGAISGAGLDVFELEPPAHDHALLAYDNVIVSPHNAGVTEDCNFNMATWSADQWGELLAGRRPPRLINPEAWDAFQTRFNEMFGAQGLSAAE